MSKKKKKPTSMVASSDYKDPDADEVDVLDINSTDNYSINIIKKHTNDVSLKDYINDLTTRMDLKDETKQKFEQYALYTYRNIAKHLYFLENDKLTLLQNQRMLTLKYHVLKKKINFVQLSVIFVSAFIALVEALQQYVKMVMFFKTIAPILASTYIGLIVAYARFYKWDELGETLTKINEKLALSINQLRKKMKYAQFYRESLPPPKFYEEYYDNINKTLEESRNDGVIEQVVQLKQEIDLLLDYREKLYYKNKLSHLKLQEVIVEKKLRTIEDFKKECDDKSISTCMDNSGNNLNKSKIKDYSYFCFFPFNMLFSNTGSSLGSRYTDGNKFFKDKLYIDDTNHNTCKDVAGFSGTCLNADADKIENDENKDFAPMTKKSETDSKTNFQG